MDLSGNICSTCCTVFPRAVLSPIDKEEEEELVALVVGASKSKSKLLTCHLCRTQLSTFAHFVKVARGNIARLRQVHEEQQVDLRQGDLRQVDLRQVDLRQVELRQGDLRQGERERKSPDTTWSLDTSILNRENVGSPRLEISVRDSPSPPVTWSRDNTVTIVALEDSQAKEAAAREANRLRNVRYRERKRAKEAEKIRGYISCVAVQGEESVERIDVTPDLSITMEEEEEEEEEEGRPVSPPPCHLAPILVPSSAPPPSCFQSSNSPLHPPQSEVDPEERRRRRNREASRRYRERARGDPELLRRMREQQNRRQKKYYARLKERKHDQSQDNSTFEDNSFSWKSEEGPLPVFPLRGGSFDSNPGSD